MAFYVNMLQQHNMLSNLVIYCNWIEQQKKSEKKNKKNESQTWFYA